MNVRSPEIIKEFGRVDENGIQTPGYVYNQKKERDYGFFESEKPFGFLSWMDMERKYFEWFGSRVCNLTGVSEPWAPGENPAGRGQGFSYMWLQVDHDHRGPRDLLSIRGWIAPEENKFMEQLEQREHMLKDEYRDYFENPPFQQFLRETDPEEYERRLRERND